MGNRDARRIREICRARANMETPRESANAATLQYPVGNLRKRQIPQHRLICLQNQTFRSRPKSAARAKSGFAQCELPEPANGIW